MFKFSAEPKRCTSVAAPVWPVVRVGPGQDPGDLTTIEDPFALEQILAAVGG